MDYSEYYCWGRRPSWVFNSGATPPADARERSPPPVCTPPDAEYVQRQRRGPPEPSEAERRLVDALHGCYLQALAVAGRPALRGLVVAGHCHGALDPVSNIVANALWYDAAFPPGDGSGASAAAGIRVVTSMALLRLVRRSINALVAFLRAYAAPCSSSSPMSEEDAMRCLCAAGANLAVAAARVEPGFDPASPRARDAFRSAVLAAGLPSPQAQEAHLAFLLDGDSPRRLLQRHGIPSPPPPPAVSSPAATAIGEEAAAPPPSQSDPIPMEVDAFTSLSPGAFRALQHKRHHFQQLHEVALTMVDLALRKYASETGPPKPRNVFARPEADHELDVVCGIHLLPYSIGNCYHLNFFATPKNDRGAFPTLFFAAVRPCPRYLTDVMTCCPVPVSKAPGGCYGCEFEGMILVHPDNEDFSGRLSQREDRAEDRVLFGCKKDLSSEFNKPLSEDYVFFEPEHHQVTSLLEMAYSDMDHDDIDMNFGCHNRVRCSVPGVLALHVI